MYNVYFVDEKRKLTVYMPVETKNEREMELRVLAAKKIGLKRICSGKKDGAIRLDRYLTLLSS